MFVHVIDYAKVLRRALIAVGVLSLVESAGLVMQLSPFMAIWPLGDASQVHLYLGAYIAAIGASLLWIGVSGELGAAIAGAVTLTVTYCGLALSLFGLSRGGANPRLVTASLVCAVAAVASAGLALWFRRFPARDVRSLHRPVYLSFAAFVLLLAFVGGALLLGMQNVFPWTLSAANAALVGCSFLGSAAYFLYGLARPIWRNAYAPLWGFLAYDLVLIAPLVARVGSVDGAHLAALLVNTAVLVYSGALAIYYLLIARSTRVWARHTWRAGGKAEPSQELAARSMKHPQTVRTLSPAAGSTSR